MKIKFVIRVHFPNVYDCLSDQLNSKRKTVNLLNTWFVWTLPVRTEATIDKMNPVKHIFNQINIIHKIFVFLNSYSFWGLAGTKFEEEKAWDIWHISSEGYILFI